MVNCMTVFSVKLLLRRLTGFRVDLIHSVGVGIAAALGVRLARQLAVPHVTQATGSDLYYELPRIERYLWNRAWIKYVDYVICNSRALKNAWENRHPQGPSPEVIYRGVDLCHYSSKTKPRNCRARFLFLGGAHRWVKGGSFLMQVWSALDRSPTFRGQLAFGGRGSVSRDVIRWRDGLRRPGNVELCGLIPPSEVKGYMERSDVIVLPSRSEGLPNIALEAAAMARAVIGNAVGGVPEVIQHGQTGLLLNPLDKAAWIETMLRVDRGDYSIQSMGMAARRRVEHCFDARSYGPKVLNVYRRLIDATN